MAVSSGAPAHIFNIVENWQNVKMGFWAVGKVPELSQKAMAAELFISPYLVRAVQP